MGRFLNLLPLGLFVALCVFMPTNTFGQDSSGINKLSNDSTQVNVYPTLDTNDIKPLNDTLKSDDSKVNVWGTVGGILGELNVSNNKNLFSLQYVEYKEISGSFLTWGEKPKSESKEYGLLYGRILTNNKSNIYTSISLGVSRMHFKKWEKIGEETDWLLGTTSIYEERNYTGYGYPIKCKLMYRLKYFGIGLDAILNSNSINSYLMLKLHVSVGKLK